MVILGKSTTLRLCRSSATGCGPRTLSLAAITLYVGQLRITWALSKLGSRTKRAAPQGPVRTTVGAGAGRPKVDQQGDDSGRRYVDSTTQVPCDAVHARVTCPRGILGTRVTSTPLLPARRYGAGGRVGRLITRRRTLAVPTDVVCETRGLSMLDGLPQLQASCGEGREDGGVGADSIVHAVTSHRQLITAAQPFTGVELGEHPPWLMAGTGKKH